MHSSAAVAWEEIDCVLLDMDGTLLDLRFDNWFWANVVPEHYARSRGLSVAAAQGELAPLFSKVAHTLPWYCIDHWSRELDLDIRALKRTAREHIRFLPGAEQFLERLKLSGKRVVMVTNSHPATLAIKDEQVAITRHFHRCYSTHSFGVPKEDASFWPRLLREEVFDTRRTLFVDDSLPVLESAHRFGIAHLRAVRRPDSGRPAHATGRFIAVEGVAELLAGAVR
jgi:HAD superfamily hydrolase (TIGR01509 family)